SETFVKEATSSMLGLDEEEMTGEVLDDTLKELVNMTIGNIFYRIDNNKSIAELGIPERLKDESSLPEVSNVHIYPFNFISFEAEEGDELKVLVEISPDEKGE
ncbi:MAG: chemotaxis protein CheX, partial [Fibrobacterota bacterium]